MSGQVAPTPRQTPAGTASRAMLCLAHDGAKRWAGKPSPESYVYLQGASHRHLEGSQLP